MGRLFEEFLITKKPQAAKNVFEKRIKNANFAFKIT